MKMDFWKQYFSRGPNAAGIIAAALFSGVLLKSHIKASKSR